MDPDPLKFPILSYVISCLDNRRRDPVSQIVTKLPLLADPRILESMEEAISDVLQTRSVLMTLGERPSEELVNEAKERIASIDSTLSRDLSKIVTSPRPKEVERMAWREMMGERESDVRRLAAEEKKGLKSVVQVMEMFKEYDKVFGEVEGRLWRVYKEGGSREEVVGILSESVLERVVICGRRLRYLPEAFGRIRGVVVMDLSNNQLEMIPDSIGGLGHLEELKVSSNLLESLPDSIGLLQHLKILDASANKLTELPDSICRCKSLVELDVSFNNISCLPTNIGDQLVHVTRLSIQLNKLCNLTSSICEMRSLRKLDVHFNKLRGLPEAIGQLTHLESLNLSSNFNDLTELPNSIGNLYNLTELDLSNNQIHTLPDTFGRLYSLHKLNLDQNPLAVPTMAIVTQGIEAVKAFMAKRWLDFLAEEERKSMLEMQEQSQTGWLTRWLNQLTKGVSGSVSGYLSPRSPRDPRDAYLDQQL